MQRRQRLKTLRKLQANLFTFSKAFRQMRSRRLFFLPLGIAIGMGIGIAINSIAIGAGVGVALGVAMAGVWERNRRR